jgi:2-amino-4-hydroxy-6-hydroxymethyldihydropteridine diphosphokinase
VRALVALGSNLGERRRHLERGLQALAELGTVTVSPLWPATPDVTGVGPDYLNTVALLETAGSDPCVLLEALLRAELRLGRDRSLGRNAPRTLDLDLIAVAGLQGFWRWPAPADLGALSGLGPELTLELPHPRARQRPFVLEPARALGWPFPDAEAIGAPSAPYDTLNNN